MWQAEQQMMRRCAQGRAERVALQRRRQGEVRRLPLTHGYVLRSPDFLPGRSRNFLHLHVQYVGWV